MADDAFDAVLLRTLARAHGLDRSDDDLTALLPAFHTRRTMAEEIAAVDLDDLPLAITYVVASPGLRAANSADDTGGQA